MPHRDRMRKFVEYWETAENCEEVAELTGITARAARVYASKLRRAGVDLKQMPGGYRYDVEGLNKLVCELREKKELYEGTEAAMKIIKKNGKKKPSKEFEGYTFECTDDDCDKKFPTPDERDEHMRVVHGD